MRPFHTGQPWPPCPPPPLLQQQLAKGKPQSIVSINIESEKIRNNRWSREAHGSHGRFRVSRLDFYNNPTLKLWPLPERITLKSLWYQHMGCLTSNSSWQSWQQRGHCRNMKPVHHYHIILWIVSNTHYKLKFKSRNTSHTWHEYLSLIIWKQAQY